MIKANSGTALIFKLGLIVTLKILSKLRLNTEFTQLLVRVFKYKNGQYLLQSWHRRLSGQYQDSKLNVVDATIVNIISSSICTAPEQKDGKDFTITLAKAVATENGRGSITSAQKLAGLSNQVLKLPLNLVRNLVQNLVQNVPRSRQK
jgi:hypothetical protein